MRVLVAVTDYSEAKAYCREKFWEMAEACILPHDDVSMVLAGEHGKWDDRPADYFVPMPDDLGTYVEDMLMHSREAMRNIAITEDFDRLVWQGLDAPYVSGDDFERVAFSDLDIVAPVISARTFPGMAVARRFELLDEGGEYLYGEEQHNIPAEELMSGELVPAGFPGGDNISISRDVFTEISWANGAHTPWYRRVAEGKPNLDCIEWYCLQALNAGYNSWVDSSSHAWHVDDGDHVPVARLWPDKNVPLEELTW